MHTHYTPVPAVHVCTHRTHMCTQFTHVHAPPLLPGLEVRFKVQSQYGTFSEENTKRDPWKSQRVLRSTLILS